MVAFRGMVMQVERIFISACKGDIQIECAQIQAHAGLGIWGDRNYGKTAYSGQNITLVEAEEIEAFQTEYSLDVDLDLAITRRNIITRGVRLNELVGKEFNIGEVRLLGVELCQPCAKLGKLLATEQLQPTAVVQRLYGRSGLRADVLTSGKIVCGTGIVTSATN
jgi:MOSC domain-containing protein YiiM